MITKRVGRALMITALLIIRTSMAEAQRVTPDAWRALAEGGGAHAPATATPLESKEAMEPAEAGQDALPGGSADIAARRKTIVGSWLDTVSVTGGLTFNSLSTNTNDGSWVFHDQGSVITTPSFPHVFSAGHGVWVHRGGRTFNQTAVQLISDLDGNLLFRNKLWQTLTLDKSRDAYRAVWKSEFTDPAGNLIVSFEGTSEGRRIKAEPLP